MHDAFQRVRSVKLACNLIAFCRQRIYLALMANARSYASVYTENYATSLVGSLALVLINAS